MTALAALAFGALLVVAGLAVYAMQVAAARQGTREALLEQRIADERERQDIYRARITELEALLSDRMRLEFGLPAAPKPDLTPPGPTLHPDVMREIDAIEDAEARAEYLSDALTFMERNPRADPAAVIGELFGTFRVPLFVPRAATMATAGDDDE